MHYFSYQDGSLHCEGVSLQDIAKEYGTPCYVYSARTMKENYQRLAHSLQGLNSTIAYALKANSNLSVIAKLANEGCGFDIVSAGELQRVIAAGGDPAVCTFAGVGKTKKEIAFALEQGIYSFNVESQAELEVINTVAGEMGVVAPIALRVNPNVDAKTHRYISTGKSENKFGIDFEYVEDAYQKAAAYKHLEIKGIQMHIGSQLTSVEPFVQAVKKVAPLAIKLKQRYGICFFSIGGGVGIVYEEALASGNPAWWKQHDMITFESYVGALRPLLEETGLHIILEPGRSIVGNAGVLLTHLTYIKKGTSKTFYMVDAGMHTLIRPSLYQGYHEIVPVQERGEACCKVDVVGPICETGDFFCQDRLLPKLEQGDVLAIMSAGAYGSSMSSTYNTHPLPCEVLVEAGEARCVRPAQSLAELLDAEKSCLR